MIDSIDRDGPQSYAAQLWQRWCELLDQHPWLPFVLPFALFMLLQWLEPSPPAHSQYPLSKAQTAAAADKSDSGEGEPGAEQAEPQPLLNYPSAYTLRIAGTCLAIVLVWPRWRSIRWRVQWFWAVATGVVGIVLWIGICRLALEDRVLVAIGLESWHSVAQRPALNPYAAFAEAPLLMVGFLTVRLFGLSVIVPLIEEFFTRGFLMRVVEKEQWWTIPLGTVTWKGAVAVTLYGVLAHPGEIFAAACWFSLVTLLYARTRNLADCIVAHAVTNGLLGVYVLTYRDWTLW